MLCRQTLELSRLRRQGISQGLCVSRKAILGYSGKSEWGFVLPFHLVWLFVNRHILNTDNWVKRQANSVSLYTSNCWHVLVLLSQVMSLVLALLCSSGLQCPAEQRLPWPCRNFQEQIRAGCSDKAPGLTSGFGHPGFQLPIARQRVLGAHLPPLISLQISSFGERGWFPTSSPVGIFAVDSSFQSPT